MQSSDVRVAHEHLRVATEHIGLEIRDDSNRPITARCREHGFHVGIAPHLHQAFGPLLVLALMEAPFFLDFRFENDVIAGFLHRLDAAREPRRVGRV